MPIKGDLSLPVEVKVFKSLLLVTTLYHLRVWFSLSLGTDTLSRRPCMYSSDMDSFSLKIVW